MGWECGETPKDDRAPIPKGPLLPGPVYHPVRPPPPPSEPLAQPALSARRMVQEQCCHNQLEELHCATGINLANEQDGCTTPYGDNASLEAMFVKVGAGPLPACRPWAPPSSGATVHLWEGLGRHSPHAPYPSPPAQEGGGTTVVSYGLQLSQ